MSPKLKYQILDKHQIEWDHKLALFRDYKLKALSLETLGL